MRSLLQLHSTFATPLGLHRYLEHCGTCSNLSVYTWIVLVHMDCAQQPGPQSNECIPHDPKLALETQESHDAPSCLQSQFFALSWCRNFSVCYDAVCLHFFDMYNSSDYFVVTCVSILFHKMMLSQRVTVEREGDKLEQRQRMLKYEVSDETLKNRQYHATFINVSSEGKESTLSLNYNRRLICRVIHMGLCQEHVI